MSDMAVFLLEQEASREAHVQRLEAQVKHLTGELERTHEKFAEALRDMRSERAELHSKIAQRFEESTVAMKEAASARRAFYNLQEQLERQTALTEALLTQVWEGSDTEVAEAAYRLQAAMKATPSS